MSDVSMRAPITSDAAFEIYLTIAGRSYLKLSELTGVSINTIRSWARTDNWKDKADFLEHQARHANHRHILSRLDSRMPKALDTIEAMMDGASSEKVKLDASKTWVEFWSRYRDLVSAATPEDSDNGDISQLSDADLFATLKRESHR